MEVFHCLRSVGISDVSVVGMLYYSCDYLKEILYLILSLAVTVGFEPGIFSEYYVIALTSVLKMAAESYVEATCASTVSGTKANV